MQQLFRKKKKLATTLGRIMRSWKRIATNCYSVWAAEWKSLYVSNWCSCKLHIRGLYSETRNLFDRTIPWRGNEALNEISSYQIFHKRWQCDHIFSKKVDRRPPPSIKKKRKLTRKFTFYPFLDVSENDPAGGGKFWAISTDLQSGMLSGNSESHLRSQNFPRAYRRERIPPKNLAVVCE